MRRRWACCARPGRRVVGKTITDELAFSLEGENTHHGTPRNPRAAGAPAGRLVQRVGRGLSRRDSRPRPGHRHRRLGARAGLVLRRVGASRPTQGSHHAARRPAVRAQLRHRGLDGEQRRPAGARRVACCRMRAHGDSARPLRLRIAEDCDRARGAGGPRTRCTTPPPDWASRRAARALCRTLAGMAGCLRLAAGAGDPGQPGRLDPRSAPRASALPSRRASRERSPRSRQRCGVASLAPACQRVPGRGTGRRRGLAGAGRAHGGAAAGRQRREARPLLPAGARAGARWRDTPACRRS
jgi:hypothetical protein